MAVRPRRDDMRAGRRVPGCAPLGSCPSEGRDTTPMCPGQCLPDRLRVAAIPAALSWQGDMMSTTAATAVPAPAKARPISPVTGWTSAGRIGAAITLVASGLLWFVAHVIGFGGQDHMTYLASHRMLAGIGGTAHNPAVP